MESLASQLIKARDSLTPDNWVKGSYFSFNSKTNQLCMCAHGAAETVANPIIKKIIAVQA